MLTLDEGRRIFKALEFCSSCGIIPIEVVFKKDVVTLKAGGRTRFGAYGLNFAFQALCAIYQAVRLAQVGMGSRTLVPSHFIIHVGTCLATCIASLWSWQAFILHPQVMVNLFNEMFRGSPKFGSRRRRPLRKFDLQELIAVLLPYVIVSMAGTSLIANMIQPDKVHLIVSLVPDEYLTAPIVLISHGLDAYLLVINSAIYLFVVSIHGLLSQNVNCKLETHLKMLKKSSGINPPTFCVHVVRVYKELVEIVLLVCFFNQSNANITYVCKVGAFTAPIILYYFTIRHFGSNVLMDIFGFWCGTGVLIIFVLIYDKAFRIPENIANLKEQLKFYIRTAPYNTPRASRTELIRRIQSVRAVGVREGEFQVLKRTSTPRILDFTLTNTCNLLVS